MNILKGRQHIQNLVATFRIYCRSFCLFQPSSLTNGNPKGIELETLNTKDGYVPSNPPPSSYSSSDNINKAIYNANKQLYVNPFEQTERETDSPRFTDRESSQIVQKLDDGLTATWHRANPPEPARSKAHLTGKPRARFEDENVKSSPSESTSSPGSGRAKFRLRKTPFGIAGSPTSGKYPANYQLMPTNPKSGRFILFQKLSTYYFVRPETLNINQK